MAIAQCNLVEMPKILPGNKSSTLNGTGYIFYTISPLGETFIQSEAWPHKSVLEIGAGYGNIVIESLKKGIGNYTVNDLSKEHLDILMARIKKILDLDPVSLSHRLNFLCARAPNALPSQTKTYDAILADKVIHFMSPNELIMFIEWCKKALKKNGKIYIMTASAYSPTYRKRLPEYLSRIEQNQAFPGYFNNVMANIEPSRMQNYPQFKVPDQILLFSRQELMSLFQHHGMEILESYSLLIPTETNAEWQQVRDEDSNVVGIVAQKIE